MLLSFFIRGSTLIFDSLILLSSSARGSKLIFDSLICSLYWTHTWRPVKLGSVPVLHLKASQTWFKLCHMSTYLDLPFTASLVALLILSHLSIWLDLQFWCQAKGFKSNSVGIFENSDLVRILPSFSPKVFLKLLSGVRTSSLCVPVSDKTIYIWCNVLCNVWSWMTCPSI